MAIFNSSSLLQDYEILPNAIFHVKQLIKEDPLLVQAYLHLGNAFQKTKQYKSAIKCYQNVIESNPNISEAYFNLASLYENVGNIPSAIEMYKKMKHNKGAAYAHYLLSQYCDWSTRESDMKHVESLVKHMHKSCTHIYLQPKHVHTLPNITPMENLQICQTMAKRASSRASFLKSSISLPNKREYIGKIRVGYISSSFVNNPIGFLMQQVYELHNKAEFEVFCYSINKMDTSRSTTSLGPQGANCFQDLSCMSTKDIASKIYDDNLQIVVFLDGYSNVDLSDLFAMHLVPVQINMMGHCGTMAGGLFDYLVADMEVAPNPEHFSEKIIYLPDSFIVTDHKQSANFVVDESMGTITFRAKYGISDDVFVYACFNQPYKIDPNLFSIWMDILHDTEETVLVLLHFNDIFVQNIKNEARKRNVDSDRIYFLDLVPRTEHMKRCRIADLVLDTRVCNGMAASCDIIWAGVPMITISGNHMHNRIGASLLKCVGLENLVATSLEHYKNLAISLHQDEQTYIEAIRKLEESRISCNLFQTHVWVEKYEKALKKAISLHELGCSPQHIYTMDI